MRTASAAPKAKPPITPPAIAPVSELLWVVVDGLLAAGIEGLLMSSELVIVVDNVAEDADVLVGTGVDWGPSVKDKSELSLL